MSAIETYNSSLFRTCRKLDATRIAVAKAAERAARHGHATAGPEIGRAWTILGHARESMKATAALGASAGIEFPKSLELESYALWRKLSRVDMEG